jgi:YesN/AraC family two-component response regulator
MLCLEKMEANEHSRLSNIGELNYINELHKREEKAQKMAVLQRLQQYAILAAIIILIVVLISTVLLWRTNKQLKARNKSLFEKYQEALKADAERREDIKYSHSNLNTSQKDALVFRVQQILGNAEAVCQHDFNLSQLAKMADSNTTYVSQVINEYYGKTFSTVLANSRIKEACRRINDEREHYSNITIEGIATSVGFKSRTAFINAFKRPVPFDTFAARFRQADAPFRAWMRDAGSPCVCRTP